MTEEGISTMSLEVTLSSLTVTLPNPVAKPLGLKKPAS